MYTKLKEKNFDLNEKEKEIIAKEYKRIEEEVEKAWSEASFFNDENNNPYVILYAYYELRNELGEYVRKLNIEGLKYLIMVALKNGVISQKSYRSIESGFDVGKIAEAHGGNGHPAAASVGITDEQRKNALELMQESKSKSLKYLADSTFKK